MKALPGLWITTVGEVAAHTMSLGLTPRTCPRPRHPHDAYWVPAAAAAGPGQSSAAKEEKP